MDNIKDFNDERDARLFRDSKRSEGHAASLFTYGKDKYRVQVIECTSKDEQSKTQIWLSRKAWDTSEDIEQLNKIKGLIDNPDFGCEIEDAVFVAKYLEKEHWFKYSRDVVRFFEGLTEKEMGTVKEFINENIKYYEDGWNSREE